MEDKLRESQQGGAGNARPAPGGQYVKRFFCHSTNCTNVKSFFCVINYVNGLSCGLSNLMISRNSDPKPSCKAS